jgi:ribosomal protein S18 acetylase RimI-like enzyme
MAWIDKVIIRHIRKADLPALEWEGEFSHFRQVYSNAFERHQKGLSVLWVAELPGTGIIGQVFVQLACDRSELADGASRAYVFSFRIKPEFRRAGLGSRMMEIVEDDLKWRNYGMVTLNVAQENEDARRLYERLGFMVAAPDPGCWSYPDQFGNWHHIEEPAWRMVKILG